MKTNKISYSKFAFAAFYVLALAFVMIFVFAGCGTMYTSKAGAKEEMVGTYKLTTYNQKDSEGNIVNRIEQLNVKAYLVVGGDGSGYYVYQDNTTPLWYDTIAIQYNKDDNDETLFKSIRFTTGKGTVTINKQKPGCGYEPTMGFNVNTKTFNYFIPDDRPSQSWLYPSYYTDVVYTKISEDADLSKVTTELDLVLSPLPRYELKNLDGVLIFHAGMVNTSIAGEVVNEEYGKYKYYIVNFDALTQKADIYYELVEGSEGAQVLTNQQLNVTIVQPNEETADKQVVIKFFEKNYVGTSTFYGPSRSLSYEVNTPQDDTGTIWTIYSNWFEKYYGDKTSIDDIVADELAAYNASLTI